MRRRRALGLAAGALLLAGSVTVGTAGLEDPLPLAVAAADPRPNIVLVTTDDQTLTDMRWMPRTRRVLGEHGATFRRALSPHPHCCPARAELLTGQYAQNNGVLNNRGPVGGLPALREPGNTLPSWLQDSGYLTGQVGKYLNLYSGEDGAQPGWTHWDASTRRAHAYFGNTTFNDGDPVRHSRNITDVVRATTLRWVAEFSAQDAPFFIWASHLAPHRTQPPGDEKWAPPRPARRHQDVLTDVRAPSLSDPTFDKRTEGQPHYWSPKDKPVVRKELQENFTRRIQSLQAVDEMVQALVGKLRRTGELKNTVIIFTSDNGYLLGEHRLVGKNALYQQSLRVPMLIRGPGIPAGSTLRQPVTITDIAPTIADFARVVPRRTQDGQSFRPVLEGRSGDWRSTQLVQTGTSDMTGPEPGWEYRGAMTRRYTYAYDPRSDFEVLHDRREDPTEMKNFAEAPRYRDVLREMRHRARALAGCSGRECSTDFGKVGRPLPRG